MRYVSLFSGIEAATVAWEPLGWQAVAFAEVDPFCCALLSTYYPGVPNLGDVTTVDWSAWQGKADVLVGGSPCQAFSVAGLRQSLKDPRGNLTLEFVRAANAIQPGFILWENVPGVLSTEDNAFGCFLAALVGADEAILPERGWTNSGVVSGPERTAAWVIKDAQFFGVAQRRRRVFVLAVRGSRNWTCAEALLPLGEGLCRDTPPRREAGKGVTHDLAPSLTSSGRGVERTGESRGQDPVVAMYLNGKGGCGRLDGESETFVAHTLRGDSYSAGEDGAGRGVPILPVAFSCKDSGADAMEDGSGKGIPLLPIPILEPDARRGALDDRDGIGVGEPGDPMYTLGAKHPHAVAFSCKDYGADATEPVVFESRFVRNGRGAPDVIAPPLKAQSGASGRGDGAPLVATWVAVRRLTPRECERLQGFPDDYTLIPNYRRKLRAGEAEEIAAYLGIPVEEARELGATPDGPRYRAIGNSMAVPVMRWIGHRIAEAHRKMSGEKRLG